MAKAQAAARFVTEVAPPQVVSVMRRGKAPSSLDTIAEDEREQLAAAYGPSSDNQQAGFAAAWSRRATPPQAREGRGKFMRELSRCFSDAHGQQAGGGGGWEGSHKLGHRRGMQELHKTCA